MIFRNFVLENFPFLEDDFDALTDYELFCKMIEYVKTLVKDNEDFRKQLEDLENYVYNLNIQDAVNNKLDEMVEDGTLAEIINQEIFTDLNDQVNTNKNNIENLQDLTSNLPEDEVNIQKLQIFNEYTNKPLRYSKLNISQYFSMLPCNFYRNLDGTIKTDFNYNSYDTTSNLIYVNRSTGTSGGDGTISSPFKTIRQALEHAETLSGATYKIICQTYRFYRNEFYESNQNTYYTPTKNIIIEPEDKTQQIIISNDDELSWTQYQGSTYQATRSSIAYVLNSRNGKNGYGCYSKIIQCETLDQCLNLRDSYYISGNTIYLHTQNGSTPDSRYFVCLGVPTFNISLENNNYLRMINCDIYTSRQIKIYNNSANNFESSILFDNVNVYYSSTSNGNGFSFDNIKSIYMKNCKTAYNQRDGFNYHYTTMPEAIKNNSFVLEENCESYENGFNDENVNNNCSTIHEKGNIIRINGIYQTSNGPVIADIDGSHTMMLHCKVYQDLADRYPFTFNNNNNTGGYAILCDIEVMQKTTLSIYSNENNFDIRLKNFKGNYENSNLNITLYEE